MNNFFSLYGDMYENSPKAVDYLTVDELFKQRL